MFAILPCVPQLFQLLETLLRLGAQFLRHSVEVDAAGHERDIRTVVNLGERNDCLGVQGAGRILHPGGDVGVTFHDPHRGFELRARRRHFINAVLQCLGLRLVPAFAELEPLLLARDGEADHGDRVHRIGRDFDVAHDRAIEVEAFEALVAERTLDDVLVEGLGGFFAAQRLDVGANVVQQPAQRLRLINDRGVGGRCQRRGEHQREGRCEHSHSHGNSPKRM